MNNNDETPSKVTAQVIYFASAKANKDAMDRDELDHDRPGPSGPSQFEYEADDDIGPIHSPEGEQTCCLGAARGHPSWGWCRG